MRASLSPKVKRFVMPKYSLPVGICLTNYCSLRRSPKSPRALSKAGPRPANLYEIRWCILRSRCICTQLRPIVYYNGTLNSILEVTERFNADIYIAITITRLSEKNFHKHASQLYSSSHSSNTGPTNIHA